MRRIIALLVLALAVASCEDDSSDRKQQQQQEVILQQGTNEIGMPSITRFNERRLLKQIYELRDQANLTTYTYTFSDYTGQLTFFCRSVGYGIPYATQFTNPMKISSWDHGITLPQADPNGLFSPSAAEGTWVLCQNPKQPSQVTPVYVEPRITVSQFPLK